MMVENVEDSKKAAVQTIRLDSAKKARTHARADLLAHLGTLIDRADSSDLEFFCKDGVSVRASRIFFARRSPVFDCMLTNGMLESNTSFINLPGIPGPALLAILEFLYTGDIVENRPNDWRMGLEIISAAHFFLLPTVDKIVEEFNMAQIPSGGDAEALQQAATMLSVALTFKCLAHDKNIAILPLISLLESNWMHSDCACHLSEEAVDFVLQHTKHKSSTENGLDLSLEEYFRFRGVLLWCMYTSSSVSLEEVDKLANEAIPVARESLYCKGLKDLSSMELTWLPEYSGDRALDDILQILHSHGTFESAIRLLAHIDWVRMPPTIFTKIVEPMKLVPDSSVLSIFRFHYTHRMISTPKLRWAHSDSFSMHNGGLVICKLESSPGSAICRLENRASEDICVWRFIVQKGKSACWQLGFVCSEKIEGLCRTWNFGGDCIHPFNESTTTVSGVIKSSDVDVAHSVCNDCRRRRGSYNGYDYSYDAYGRAAANSVKLAEQLEFTYCRSARNCTVKVDGTQLQSRWTELPSTDIFPILYFGNNSPAQVNLEIVSGFEIF